MQKKGISHIEVIMSFILFIGFVIFALYFFSPTRTDRLVDSSIDYSIREIRDNASLEVDIYTVTMDVTGGGVREISIQGVPLEKSLRVENRNGALVNSGRSGDLMTFDSDLVHEGNEAEGYAIFLFSDEFTPGGLGGGSVVNNYEIASADSEDYISVMRMKELKEYYESSYDDLKRNFNIPGRVNFGFKLLLDSGEEVVAEKEIPQGIEIYSESERVEILNATGGREFGDFNVKVW